MNKFYPNLKEVYLNPYFGTSDFLESGSKDEKLIKKCHPGVKIVKIPANIDSNFFDYIDNESCVYMESVFKLIELIRHKKCLFKTSGEIVANSGKFRSFFCDFDTFEFINECRHRKIYFIFDETPNCNSYNCTDLLKLSSFDNNENKEKMIKQFYMLMTNSAIEEIIYSAKKNSIIYEIARAEGKKVGHTHEEYINSEKIIALIQNIKNLSKDFSGSKNDTELMNTLNISRNTLKRYKRILKEQGESLNTKQKS